MATYPLTERFRKFDGLKMSIVKEQANPSSLLGDALLDVIRQAIKEAMREANANGNSTELLTPEDLADRLKLPISWGYEQCRQGNTDPPIRPYIRFDLAEVLASQKKS